MTIRTVNVSIEGETPSMARLLAPTGMETPFQAPVSVDVDGGTTSLIRESKTGQWAVIVTPSEPRSPIMLRYRFSDDDALSYPSAIFEHRPNQYTEAAAMLANDAAKVAADAGGGYSGLDALVQAAASKFVYDHPERRFNDGHEAVPYLGCGTTPGSCVDINTCLVASLRAAGYEAGYIVGYFFPEEGRGFTYDMHCWVVTRFADRCLEWDIAHHMKLGVLPVSPALNPKPGVRVSLGHSMGLLYPVNKGIDLKLLAQPLWLLQDGLVQKPKLTVQLLLDD